MNGHGHHRVNGHVSGRVHDRGRLRVDGRGHGHHHVNGHVSGRVHDRGHLRVDGRGHGHHHVNGHVSGRVRDRGRLSVDGRDRGHVKGRHHAHVHRRVRANGHVHRRVRADDRAGAGADVHVLGCVRHHCNTASCFWQAATRQYQQSRYQRTYSTTGRYRPVRIPVLRA